MKIAYSAALSLLFLLVGKAQVPNGDFEVWQDSVPASWITLGEHVPKYMKGETSTSDAFTGNFALKCKNVLMQFQHSYTVIVPGWITQENVPISEPPICFSGAYKIVNNTKDTLFAILTLKTNTVVIGKATFTATGQVNNYSTFCVAPVYTGTSIPDNIDILISFNKMAPHSNESLDTYFLIDAVEILRPTFLPQHEPKNSFKFNYNFSSDEINIANSGIEKTEFDIKVLSIGGLVLTSRHCSSVPYFQNASNFSSGLYIVQIVESNGRVNNFRFVK